jgi:hypothetical protein
MCLPFQNVLEMPLHLGEFLYLWTGLDFDTTTEACLAKQTRKLSSFQVQIYYQPLQSIFRNCLKMHTNPHPRLSWEISKVSHLLQLGISLLKVCTASSAWDLTSHTHQLFATVWIWTCGSMFQFPTSIRMPFVTKLELCTCSGGRGKCHSHLALHCSSIYDL